jgi:hypothetical protein
MMNISITCIVKDGDSKLLISLIRSHTPLVESVPSQDSLRILTPFLMQALWLSGNRDHFRQIFQIDKLNYRMKLRNQM